MLSPPLFQFESQAVLGLVCVVCKWPVGGEHLISGILCVCVGAVRAGQPCGLASTEGAGQAALISQCTQVQVPGQGKEATTPLYSPAPCRFCCFVLPCWRRLYSECVPGHRDEGVYTRSAFQDCGDYSFWLVLEKRSAKRHPTLRHGKLEGHSSTKTATRWLVLALSGNGQQVKLRF